jgi:hypothetical protein
VEEKYSPKRVFVVFLAAGICWSNVWKMLKVCGSIRRTRTTQVLWSIYNLLECAKKKPGNNQPKDRRIPASISMLKNKIVVTLPSDLLKHNSVTLTLSSLNRAPVDLNDSVRVTIANGAVKDDDLSCKLTVSLDIRNLQLQTGDSKLMKPWCLRIPTGTIMIFIISPSE